MEKASYWNPKPAYNPSKANKGRPLEELIKYQNQLYKSRNVSNIQKISTPWKVIRRGKDIVNAYPEEKSTLDFRGTAKGGIPVSFDAKESEDIKGLPLKYIAQHQVDYIRQALELGEISFIICNIKPLDSYFIITGQKVIDKWDAWKANKGKRGFNLIPVEEMTVIKNTHSGYVLDYLPAAIQLTKA